MFLVCYGITNIKESVTKLKFTEKKRTQKVERTTNRGQEAQTCADRGSEELKRGVSGTRT